jgi:F-type H+-transporting ATPase subunit b
MLIDWFTVAVQIVNFLILVFLLKYFLYGRIIKAMDEREQRIAARLHEAEHQQQEAEAEAASYQQKQQALESKRAELLAQAREDADTQRQELLATARQEVESMQARWHKAVRDEKDAFLRNLRQRASQQTLAMARRTLMDLAHADLEQQMMAAFVEQLQTLDADVWEALAKSQQDSQQPLVVHSAFEVPPAARQQLRHLLQERLGETVTVRFETAPEVICGIELQTDGRKIAWSLEHYLEALEESLATAFEEESREATVVNQTGAAPQTGDEGDDDAGA